MGRKQGPHNQRGQGVLTPHFKTWGVRIALYHPLTFWPTLTTKKGVKSFDLGGC